MRFHEAGWNRRSSGYEVEGTSCEHISLNSRRAPLSLPKPCCCTYEQILTPEDIPESYQGISKSSLANPSTSLNTWEYSEKSINSSPLQSVAHAVFANLLLLIQSGKRIVFPRRLSTCLISAVYPGSSKNLNMAAMSRDSQMRRVAKKP